MKKYSQLISRSIPAVILWAMLFAHNTQESLAATIAANKRYTRYNKEVLITPPPSKDHTKKNMKRLLELKNKRLPNEILLLTDTLLTTAIAEKNLTNILMILECKEYALSSIDWGRRWEIFEDIHQVNQSVSSFAPEDQSVWYWHTIKIYLENSNYERNNTTDEPHPYNPENWNERQMVQFITPLLRAAVYSLSQIEGELSFEQKECCGNGGEKNLKLGTPYWYLYLDGISWEQIGNFTWLQRKSIYNTIEEPLKKLFQRYPEQKLLQEYTNAKIKSDLRLDSWEQRLDELIPQAMRHTDKRWLLPILKEAKTYYQGKGNYNAAITLYERYIATHKIEDRELNNELKWLKKPHLSLFIEADNCLEGDSPRIFVQRYNLTNYNLTVEKVSYPISSKKMSTKVRKYSSQKIDKGAPLSPYTVEVDTIVLEGLKVGQYNIRLSVDGDKDNIYQREGAIRVTDQLPVMMNSHISQTNKQQVFHAITGDPIKDKFILLKVSYKKDGEEQFIPVAKVTSDSFGFLPFHPEAGYFRRDTKSNEEPMRYITKSYYGHTPFNPNSMEYRGIIITDRKLYRPGQLVHFNIIAYQTAYKKEKVELSTGLPIKVSLYNASGKEVQKVEGKTDENGMYEGAITLPEDGLRGSFRLEAELLKGVHIAQKSLTIAEYKRPTFEVKLDRLKGYFTIDQEVQLSGSARTLSGNALGGGKVQYKLYGKYYIWGKNFYHNSDGEELIQEGIAEINPVSGAFSFPARLSNLKPDYIGNKEGIFEHHNFRCEVVVTSPSGESYREETYINVGTQEVRFFYKGKNVFIREYAQQAEKITLSINNSNHAPISGKLHYQITAKGDEQQRVLVEDTVEAHKPFTTPRSWYELPTGRYQLSCSHTLENGKEVKRDLTEFLVFSEKDKTLSLAQDLWAYAPSHEFTDQALPYLYICSQNRNQAIYYTISWEGGVETKEMPRVKENTLQRISLPIPKTTDYTTSQINVIVYAVRNGELWREEFSFRRKRDDLSPQINWTSFRDRTQAGAKEEWKVKVTYPDGTPFAQRPLSVWMYDAALDLIENNEMPYMQQIMIPHIPYIVLEKNLSFNKRDIGNILKNGVLKVNWSNDPRAARIYGNTAPSPSMDFAESAPMAIPMEGNKQSRAAKEEAPEVTIRSNFAETAFFYPSLRTDDKGEVAWSVTLPQTLTRWKLALFTYDSKLNNSYQQRFIEAYKEFSVETNIPRFVRIGDETMITGTLRSLIDKPLDATLTMELFNPENEEVLHREEKALNLLPNSTEGFAFKHKCFSELALVGIRIFARAGQITDGEQYIIPQLPSGKRTIRSLPIANIGEEQYSYAIAPLFSGKTMQEGATLSVDVLANTSLLALQSLPILSQPTTPNAIDLMAAAYSNSIGASLMRQESVRQWVDKRKEKLQISSYKSPLALRESLKQVNLDETPWVSAAHEEEQRINKMINFMHSSDRQVLPLLTRLNELQSKRGHWSWYSGMDDNPYLTATMIEDLSRMLPSLQGEEEKQLVISMLNKAWNGYIQHLVRQREELRKRKGNEESMLYSLTEYLYLFYNFAGFNPPTSGKEKELHEYALQLLQRKASQMPLTTLPLAGVALMKSGDREEAEALAATLESHLTKDKEQGAFFANLGHSYYWYNPFMRMQLATVEFFSLMGNREYTIAAMKKWVLGQKRTTRWESSLSTLWAIETLLQKGAKGSDILTEDEVQVTIPLRNQAPIQQSGEEISLSTTIKQVDVTQPMVISHQKPMAQLWGGIYANFYQEYAQMEANGTKALNVLRKIYVQRAQERKDVLEAVTERTMLYPGDKIVIKIEIDNDRAMDFVSIIDTRLGCCEPIEQTSGYHGIWSLGYYQEVRDSETRFYINHLPRGKHSLQYEQMVVRSGSYTPGIATIQSVYAPEYTAHTAGEKAISIRANK